MPYPISFEMTKSSKEKKVKNKVPSSISKDISCKDKSARYLTIARKYELIQGILNKEYTQACASRMFCVSRTAVCGIMKNKDSIIQAYNKQQLQGESSLRTRVAVGKYDGVGDALHQWLCSVRSNNETFKVAVSWNMAQAQAKLLANELGVGDEFKASTGWLSKWIKKYGVSGPMLSGKLGDIEATSELELDKPAISSENIL